MGDFLDKVKDEVEKTLEAVEPMGGSQTSPDITRVAEAAGLGDADDSASPAAEEEAREGQ
jgi:hypothetical protein